MLDMTNDSSKKGKIILRYVVFGDSCPRKQKSAPPLRFLNTNYSRHLYSHVVNIVHLIIISLHRSSESTS